MITQDEKAELRRLIQREILASMNVLLNGVTQSAQVQQEDILGLFPGLDKISQRPLVLPYGVAARAPDGTPNLTARIGEHPASRYVIGHRDANRPDPGAGCSMLYNSFGQKIWLQNGKILLGGADSTEPVPLGTQLALYLAALVTAIGELASASSGIGSIVASLVPFIQLIPGLSPLQLAALAALQLQATTDSGAASEAGADANSAQSTYVTSGKILSSESFARKGGS